MALACFAVSPFCCAGRWCLCLSVLACCEWQCWHLAAQDGFL